MSTDLQNTYADKQTITGAAFESTNSIDHGASTGRGPGPSRGIYLVISNRVLWTDAITAPIFVLESTNAVSAPGVPDFTSPTNVASYTASTALVPAGEIIVQVALPTIEERYTQITATWTTAVSPAITDCLSAFLTTDPQATFPGRAAVVVA